MYLHFTPLDCVYVVSASGAVLQWSRGESLKPIMPPSSKTSGASLLNWILRRRPPAAFWLELSNFYINVNQYSQYSEKVCTSLYAKPSLTQSWLVIKNPSVSEDLFQTLHLCILKYIDVTIGELYSWWCDAVKMSITHDANLIPL